MTSDLNNARIVIVGASLAGLRAAESLRDAAVADQSS
jgi:monoamine oxidase